MSVKNKEYQSKDNEVDLIGGMKSLWVSRRKIFRCVVLFSSLGLFIAIFSPKEYTASVTIIPSVENSKGLGGNLSGIANMVGINLGSGAANESGISPDLYPEITKSLPFQKELLSTLLTIKGVENKISFKDYYQEIHSPGFLSLIKKYTIGLPRVVIGLFKSSDNNPINNIEENEILSISNKDNELINLLSNKITVGYFSSEKYLKISVVMPEAMAAAELARKVQNLLQKYIINFNIQKSEEQLKFINERFKEKENEFLKIQNELAKFKDENQNINTSLGNTQLESLNRRYDLVFGVYSELAKQIETQKIKVKQATPVFTILKPVSIPLKYSSPKRMMIVVVWSVLGFIIGVGYVLLKIFFERVRLNWKEE